MAKHKDSDKDKWFEEICLRIEQGEPLRRILMGDKAPMRSALFYKLLEQPDKAKRYTRAREVFADVVFDEMLDIADCEDNDVIETDEGVRVNHDVVQRDRLRVDTRKWMLSKLQPKKYGDKLDIDHTTGGDKIEPTKIIFGNGNKAE